MSAYPRSDHVRFLTQQSVDYDGIVADVNTGALYPFIAKPWDPPRLEAILKRELGVFMAQRAIARSGSEPSCQHLIPAVLKHLTHADTIHPI